MTGPVTHLEPAHCLTRLATWLALALSGTVLFLALWIVLPAPTSTLLPLAVGAPELSAWLMLGALLGAGLALPGARRGRVARAALVAATGAIVLSALPLARVPATSHRFDRAMRDALGEDFLRSLPPATVSAMRPRSLVAADLFRPAPSGQARVSRGVAVADASGVPLTVDVYQPIAPGRYPAIVQLYGGAWQRGEPGDDAAFGRYLAAHGYVVFAIDYRHAPRWQWPAQLEDVRTALAWIREHGGAYGADVSRTALVGRSSGAQLALLAAYAPGAVPVRAVISYYGPVDLVEGYRNPPRPDPLGVRAVEEAYLGGPPASRIAAYREASPITHATRPLPPTLLIYGGRDHIVEPRFGRLLHERLRATGTTSVLLEIPWAEHAFDKVGSGPSAQLALYHVERFLAWALKGEARGAREGGALGS